MGKITEEQLNDIKETLERWVNDVLDEGTCAEILMHRLGYQNEDNYDELFEEIEEIVVEFRESLF